jgi:hypothetical protein
LLIIARFSLMRQKELHIHEWGRLLPLQPRPKPSRNATIATARITPKSSKPMGIASGYAHGDYRRTLPMIISYSSLMFS